MKSTSVRGKLKKAKSLRAAPEEIFAEAPPKKWVPLPYMRKALRFMLSRGAAGLLLDPGLRKTSITLAAIKTLKKQLGGVPFLIIAPLRVCHLVWPKESRKWEEFRELKVEVLHGPKKDEALAREADIYCINPEGLKWLADRMDEGEAPNFYGLVIDESTLFKRSNTGRFKLLKPMLRRFKRRYILTGTPAPNGLLDLFGQAFILDLGNSLGSYITQYRREYFYPTGYGGYTWLPQEGAEDRIYERLAPLMLRMERKDYLDLPPLIGMAGADDEIRVEVELPPKARKTYDELEENLIAEIRGNIVTAVNAGVASMKCRQVANGGLYTDRAQSKWLKVHDAKTDAMSELVEEFNGKPVLVAVDFHHDAERLRKRFGKNTPYLGAGVSVKEMKRIEAAWNAGDTPVLLMNPASPHGLNMQDAFEASVVWHSLTWNLEYYLQFIMRIHRSGVKKLVNVHHVVALDTVDEAMMIALARKDGTQGALLRALKEYSEGKRRRRAMKDNKLFQSDAVNMARRIAGL